jgi:hypothetical protein
VPATARKSFTKDASAHCLSAFVSTKDVQGARSVLLGRRSRLVVRLSEYTLSPTIFVRSANLLLLLRTARIFVVTGVALRPRTQSKV